MRGFGPNLSANARCYLGLVNPALTRLLPHSPFDDEGWLLYYVKSAHYNREQPDLCLVHVAQSRHGCAELDPAYEWATPPVLLTSMAASLRGRRA